MKKEKTAILAVFLTALILVGGLVSLAPKQVFAQAAGVAVDAASVRLFNSAGGTGYTIRTSTVGLSVRNEDTAQSTMTTNDASFQFGKKVGGFIPQAYPTQAFVTLTPDAVGEILVDSNTTKGPALVISTGTNIGAWIYLSSGSIMRPVIQ